MYGQPGFEVTFKSCNDSQVAHNIHEFWSEECHSKK
jgi:hypothetical protein